MKPLPLASFFLLLVSFSVAGCAGSTFTHAPPPAGRRGLPVKIERVDLALAVWEEIRVEGAPSFKIGGPPSYVRELPRALAEYDLVREVVAVPWRPQQGDVFLKITDTAQADLRTSWGTAKIAATILFLGLPIPLFDYDARVSSAMTLTSEPTPCVEPLNLELTGTTHLSGNFLAFYGADDARHRLAEEHARRMGARIAERLDENRAWLARAKAGLAGCPNP